MEKLNQKKFRGEIKLIEGDVTEINEFKDNTLSLIISNELFCDLDRKGLQKALKEFYRILKPGGQMCQSELIACSVTPSQSLFIKADSYSETNNPKYEWFSPCADEIIASMYRTGFREFCIKNFDTNVQLVPTEALQELQGWNLDKEFFRNFETELEERWLEYPLEYVIYCKKF